MLDDSFLGFPQEYADFLLRNTQPPFQYFVIVLLIKWYCESKAVEEVHNDFHENVRRPSIIGSDPVVEGNHKAYLSFLWKPKKQQNVEGEAEFDSQRNWWKCQVAQLSSSSRRY